MTQTAETEIADLVAAASAGDRRALSGVLGWLYPQIVDYARRQLPRHGAVDAEDIAQQTCLAIADRPRHWAGVDHLLAHAMTVARRRVVDQCRWSARHPGELAASPPEQVGDLPEIGVDDRLVLPGLLAAVSERSRQILLLRLGLGLGAAEVGRRLDMSAGAVRVAQHRALKAIREGRPQRHGVQPCGTDPGYRRHRRRGERVCVACRRAHNEYGRSRYRAQAISRFAREGSP